MVVVSCVTLMTVLQPFKKGSRHLYANTVFMLFLALLYIILLLTVIFWNQHHQVFVVLAKLAAALPLLYLSALIVHWLYSHRRFGGQLVRTLQAWRHGYQTLN